MTPTMLGVDHPEWTTVTPRPDVRFIFGQRLKLTTQQANAANVLLHRAGDTLYIIDSGALPRMRKSILAAAADLGPVARAVLIATHAHTDHVGNNDVLWEVAAQDHRLLMTARCRRYLKDMPAYYAATAALTADEPGVVEFTRHRTGERGYWQNLLRVYEPFRPAAERSETLERYLRVPLDIGGRARMGWQLDDNVWILPTAGHTRDSLAVYFPKLGILHAADETNRHCHVFADADNDRCDDFFLDLLAWARTGAVRLMVDSHSFKLFDPDSIETLTRQRREREATEFALFDALLRGAGSAGVRYDEIFDALRGTDYWEREIARLVAIFPEAVPFVIRSRLERAGVEAFDTAAGRRYRLPPVEAESHGRGLRNDALER